MQVFTRKILFTILVLGYKKLNNDYAYLLFLISMPSRTILINSFIFSWPVNCDSNHHISIHQRLVSSCLPTKPKNINEVIKHKPYLHKYHRLCFFFCFSLFSETSLIQIPKIQNLKYLSKISETDFCAFYSFTSETPLFDCDTMF